MKKEIARGAEAIIILDQGLIKKNRIQKNYRIKEIDSELIKKRTRSEAKIMKKLKGLAPEIIKEGKTTIEMEYIEGEVLKNILDKNTKLALQIGKNTSSIHDKNVIHGDLTTSNMILDKNKNVRFIDFGLSFVSEKIEDKAVDLHLFKEAVESKHYLHEKEIWEDFLKGYNPKNRDEILRRLQLVEKRGRNKDKH